MNQGEPVEKHLTACHLRLVLTLLAVEGGRQKVLTIDGSSYSLSSYGKTQDAKMAPLSCFIKIEAFASVLRNAF